MYEAPGTQLSAGRASELETASWELVPGLFQALVSYGRPVLLELGCDADSLLPLSKNRQDGPKRPSDCQCGTVPTLAPLRV